MPISPKTTPSADKLKPAAPIAEAGLMLSAEILLTYISMNIGISSLTSALVQFAYGGDSASNPDRLPPLDLPTL